jgi:hypothetical protein
MLKKEKRKKKKRKRDNFSQLLLNRSCTEVLTDSIRRFPEKGSAASLFKEKLLDGHKRKTRFYGESRGVGPET